jgi:CrcB protein
MQHVLLVGAGGFVGSAFRYLVSTSVQRWLGESWLPYGTLAVNIAGCFLIGLLAGLADSRQLLTEETRLVLMIGLLGGFTTYSTFAYDALALLRNGGIAAAIAYVVLHIVVGIAAVWLGHLITA